MRMIQDVVDLVSLDPQDVPSIVLHLFVPSLSERLKDTVSERSLEPNVAEMCGVMVLFDIFPEVFRH